MNKVFKVANEFYFAYHYCKTKEEYIEMVDAYTLDQKTTTFTELEYNQIEEELYSLIQTVSDLIDCKNKLEDNLK